MSIKVGDKVLLVVHAYHVLIGEVSEILPGVRRVALKGTVRPLSDPRNDLSAFLADGFTNQTSYAYLGNVPDTSYLYAVEWTKSIPKGRIRS